MQIPIHKSFRFRILLASIVVEVLMLSFLLFNSVRLVNKAINEQTNIRLTSISPLLQAALSTKLFERNFPAIDEILGHLISRDNQGYSYMAVVDERGQLFALEGDIAPGDLPIQDRSVEDAISDGVYDTQVPLFVDDYQVGTVYYGISIANMLDSKHLLLQQGMLIAAAEVLMTLIILSITGYFLTRHIGELIMFARRVSSGDYDMKPRGMGADEFGILADSFTTMTQTVKSRIEELHESRAALATSKAQFESMFNSMAEGVVLLDPDRVVVLANPSMGKMFGYEVEELLGKQLPFLYAKVEDYQENGKRFSGAEEFLNTPYRNEFRRKDGSQFCGETILSAVRDLQGEIQWFVGIVRDISAELAATRALAEEKERAQVTLQSIGDGVITTDTEGMVVYLNPVAEAITGWFLDEALGQPLDQVFYVVHERTRHKGINPVERCLKEQRIIEVANDMVLIDRTGQEYYIEDSAAPIRNYDGQVIGAVLVFHDVTKTKSMSRQLVWQATHDPLTGLLNRSQLEASLRRLIADARKHGHQHAMLYLDLDQFKLVNDTCGHVAGDELLRQLSSLLQSQLRDVDYLARMGGDEFGVLLENCSHEHVNEIATRLRKVVDEYVFVWREKSFRVGVSIGVVEVDKDCHNITSVLSAVDMACYIAKDSGRNSIHFHTPDDEEVALRHGEMDWVARINQALEQDKFILYVQPIKPIQEVHALPHYEVLIRLQEGNDVILPMAFIPAAERYNLISQLDRWVVRHTFEWLEQHPDFEGVFTINLSGTTLGDKEFLPFVTTYFDEGRVDPARICFEITETAAISNLSLAMGFIDEVKRLGAAFALDDFGTGLSSFNYLKNLPVDYLKIDGAFVREIDRDLVSYTMVESICHVGRVMGLKMIAEFVENEAILRKVRDLGIDYAQGYGIQKPFPLAQIHNAKSGSLSQ